MTRARAFHFHLFLHYNDIATRALKRVVIVRMHMLRVRADRNVGAHKSMVFFFIPF